MKKKILVIGILFLCIPLFGQSDFGKITIKVQGIKNKKGSISIAIFKSDDDFKNEKFSHVTRIKADSEVIHTFEKIEYGVYAVAVYHDENDNLKLDLNLVGFPKEGYGFSNNIKGVLGPPKFKDTSFQINQSISNFTIQLIY